MSVFLLRMKISDRNRVPEGLEKNQIIIGWSKARLMNPRLKEQQFKERMEQAYPDKSKSFFSRSAKKMWNFIRKMKVGDLVVVPSPKEKGFYVAEVTGDTEFLKDKKADDTAHRRSVKWLNGKKLTSYSAKDNFKYRQVACSIMDKEQSRYILKRFTSPKRTGIGIDGDELYQQRARQALPILVRQARARQEITYTNLKEELGMPNARNLNKVLDAVGISLKNLSKKWKQEIPRINAIVVNKNTGLPGSGIDSHIPVLKNLSKQKRKNYIRTEIWEEIFDYERWDDVLKALELEPDIISAEEGKRIIQDTASPRKGGGGESKEHKNLKQFIKDNPKKIGIKYQGLKAETERSLWSGDSMDVSFENKKHWIGIEVKSKRSDKDDIRRGLFQCVKYQAVMEKQLTVNQIKKKVSVILVLDGKLTKGTIRISNILGITEWRYWKGLTIMTHPD